MKNVLNTKFAVLYHLQKKRGDPDRDTRDLWRRSWESHSSYSLNGGAASSNGKDDFWAALQPNYNYIMDTNLIDSCREADGEIVEFLSFQESREGDSLVSCFGKVSVCQLLYSTHSKSYRAIICRQRHRNRTDLI